MTLKNFINYYLSSATNQQINYMKKLRYIKIFKEDLDRKLLAVQSIKKHTRF